MESDETPYSTDSSDEQATAVGAGGKGRKKSSASSSKQSKTTTQPSTEKLTPSDERWPTDLPPGEKTCIKSRKKELRTAMNQGKFNFCWAVAIARNMEAIILARTNEEVALSPQHLINNIKKKNEDSGDITKFIVLRNFLKEQGLVTEKTCPYIGLLDQLCPKNCETSEEITYKIKDLVYFKSKHVIEEQVIKLVKESPVVAVIDVYKSFQIGYKNEIYDGQTDPKDSYSGRHAVLLTGFGTTLGGVSFWEIQNSWGPEWGENGFGKIVRKTSRDINKPSMLLKIIKLEMEI